jgi:predicted MFS family arabinose efflux permease
VVGAGFLLGALAAGRVATYVGIGRTMIGALALVGLADLIVPLAGGTPLAVGLLLIAAQCLFGLGVVAFRVSAASLRQGLTPDRLLGRVNASARVVVQGLTPLGALLGGALGARLGLRETLVLAAGGELLAALWLLASPISRLREAPAPAAGR